MKDALSLARAAEDAFRPLTLARNIAWWESNVDATDENTRRQADAELAFSDALADRDLFGAIETARGNGNDSDHARTLELLANAMRRHQIPSSLRERIVELGASVETRFSRHRGVVAGKQVDDNEIKQILRDSEDPDERREAWEASKTVGGEVAEDVRELARMRNEAARSLGHRDWFALSIATDEMDERKLLETLAAADRATSEPFARWKGSLDARLAERFRCDVSELRPWHYADPFFQEPPAEGSVDLDPLFKGKDVVTLARRTFEGIGFEVEGIVERSDLYPRAGKNQHAFCIDVDRSGRCPHPCERDRQPQLDRHDAPRARPRGLRPRVRRRAFVGVARHAPRHAPRRRRSSSERWRATASGSSASSGSMRARRTSSGVGCVPRELPSSWSSRAGCWS